MDSTFFNVYFVRGHSLIAKLIRFFDKGKGFTHVAIGLPNDNLHVLDSQYLYGVRPRHFRFSDYEIVKVQLDINKVYQRIGEKYDFRLFLYFAFRVGKPWDTPHQLICSELVADAIGLENTYLTPNQLYEILTKESD